MGVTALFLPQLKIDVWSADGTVEFDGSTLAIENEDPSIDLEPAVRFIKEVSGDGDPEELVGKIRKIAEIEELGAEHFRDSVILGDTAYEVVEGFIATPRRVITEVAKTSYGNEKEMQDWKKKGVKAKPQGAAKEPSTPAPEKPATPPAAEAQEAAPPDEADPGAEQKPESEAEELARLLLEKL